MNTQKVIKIGNSLGITLPSRFIKALSVKAGDEVSVIQSTDTSIIISFPHPHQLSLTSTKEQAPSPIK